MRNLLIAVLYISLFFGSYSKADIDIQPGISGAWIADSSGQGVFINIARVNDRPNFVVTWYSYLDGVPIWLVGSQPFDYGVEQLTIPMSITSGGQWGNNFVSDDVVVSEWGNVTVNFTDCSAGLLQYEAIDENFGFGSIVLNRLTNTDGLSCHETSDTSDKESLAFMREEEKMARDVYLLFFRNYGVNMFNNIASSEQTHMDAVLNLMNVYNVPDSSTGVEGTFNNVDLQDLYDALIAMGESSLENAYLAGALIEETDIKDLMAFEEGTVATDILNTYGNLLCGSRNHMRAFVKQYQNLTGKVYEVQIPEMAEVVAEILSSDNEQCGKP